MTKPEYLALIEAIDEAGDCCPDCVKEYIKVAVNKMMKEGK